MLGSSDLPSGKAQAAVIVPALSRMSCAAATAKVPFLKYNVANRRIVVPSTTHICLHPV